MDILIGHLKTITAHFDEYNVDNIQDEEALFALTMSEEKAAAVLADIEKARTFIING